MKTLSFQQPWASLVALGIKDVENRTWNTPHRGKFLIHASSKRVPRDFEYNLPIEWTAELTNHLAFGNIPELQALPTSAIIGYVELDSIVDNSQSEWASPGALHWVLKNAYIFDEPITGVKGKLHFFDYPLDENNLPPAHKVELRWPTFKAGTLTIPCTDDYCRHQLDAEVLSFDIGTAFDMLFNDDNTMKKVKKVVLQGLTETHTFPIGDNYVYEPYNEDDKPFRVFSFDSTDSDNCVDWQLVGFEVKF